MQTNKRVSIQIDLSKETRVPVPSFVQHDTNIIEITVVENDIAADMGRIGRIVANYRRPDKQVISRLLTLEKNKAVYELGAEEMEIAGIGDIEFQFHSGDDMQRVSTTPMRVIISNVIGTHKIYENDRQLPLLQSLFVEVKVNGDYAKEQGEYAQAQGDIAAIEAANLAQLKTEVSTVVEDANTAKTNADTAATHAQTQGDYAKSEADRAVSKLAELDGINATQINGRLDTVSAELAQNTNKNPIYLSDYGVHYSKTASENTSLIKQAIAVAEAENRPLIFPWVPNGQWININESLIVNGGIKISGYGDNTRIRQNVFPNQIFDVVGPDVIIEDMFLSSVPFTVSEYVIYRGSQRPSFYAGVVACGDRIKVRRLKVDNMVTGVIFASWDVALGLKRTQLDGCSAEDITSSNVNFNLVLQGVKNFNFSNIKGSYKFMPGTTTPPHLIYIDNNNDFNENVNGGDAISYNGESSYAYQFKGIKGGVFNRLIADKSEGILHIRDCFDVLINTVNATNDPWKDITQASIELGGENNNVIVDNINLKITGDGKPVRFSSQTSNSVIRNAKIEVNHTTTPTDTEVRYDVEVNGANNLAENIECKNIGTGERNGCVGIWGGTNNSIVSPKTSGNKHGVGIRTGAGHTLKNYLLSDIKNFTVRALSIGTNAVLYPTGGVGEQNRLIAYDRGDANGSASNVVARTSSGHTWSIPYGTFTFTNDYRIYNSVGAGAMASLDLATPNIDFSAGIKYADRETLAVRAIDRSNYIGVRLNHHTSQAYIAKYDAGVETILSQIPFTVQIGRRYKLRIVTFGSQIDFYLDGRHIASYTLTADEMTKFGSTTNHGIVGRAQANGLWDNLEWRKLD